MKTLSGDIEEAHRMACAMKQTFYEDPMTGLQVFTAVHLRSRPCCGCGCRHCPYRKGSEARQLLCSSSFLNGSIDDISDKIDLLFWSGGKDSFLAFRRLQKQALRPVVLLTTYDETTRRVAHQGVYIDDIITQARVMQTPLLGVPVGGAEYITIVHKAMKRLRDHGIDIERVVFGDLHLAHIRNWRDSHLANLGTSLYYPLWNVSYADLLDELTQSSAIITVSSVDDRASDAGIRVGDRFDKEFISRLPRYIDQFGENGEFHTLVHIPS